MDQIFLRRLLKYLFGRLWSFPFVAMHRLRGRSIPWSTTIHGMWPKLRGTIHLGEKVTLQTNVRRSRISVGPEATFEMGDRSYANEGLYVICNRSVSIGKRVLIGFSVTIMDTDAHGLEDRSSPKLGAIVIGDGAWIGANTTILKGVSIGEGAVIGAGSVVTRSIPALTLAAGNPCRIVRSIEGSGVRQTAAE